MSLLTIPPPQSTDSASPVRKSSSRESRPNQSIFNSPVRPPRRWRYELKYLVPRQIKQPLLRDLSHLVDPDNFGDADGCYTVRSLYFDSAAGRCFREKADGICRRNKVRIRYYPDKGEESAIKFEVKYRDGTRISKDVAALPYDEYVRILPALQRASNNSLLPYSDAAPELVSFLTLKQRYLMAPKLNVQFRRWACHGRGDRGVRVTLDDMLVGSPARDVLQSPRPRPLLPIGVGGIFEIKVEKSIPIWLRILIQKYGLRLRAVSKYAHVAANTSVGFSRELQPA